MTARPQRPGILRRVGGTTTVIPLTLSNAKYFDDLMITIKLKNKTKNNNL